MKDEQFNILVELIGKTNDRMDEQYNTLSDQIKKTNDRMDEQYNTLSDQIKGTEDSLNKRIDNLAQEMNSKFVDIENIIIGQSQIREMHIKELEERIDKRLKVANL